MSASGKFAAGCGAKAENPAGADRDARIPAGLAPSRIAEMTRGEGVLGLAVTARSAPPLPEDEGVSGPTSGPPIRMRVRGDAASPRARGAGCARCSRDIEREPDQLRSSRAIRSASSVSPSASVAAGPGPRSGAASPSVHAGGDAQATAPPVNVAGGRECRGRRDRQLNQAELRHGASIVRRCSRSLRPMGRVPPLPRCSTC